MHQKSVVSCNLVAQVVALGLSMRLDNKLSHSRTETLVTEVLPSRPLLSRCEPIARLVTQKLFNCHLSLALGTNLILWQCEK